ncbi:hypothetical protein [Verrucomicrobium sp. BvORR034]|uniref:hypothetical protein n=1 Tax=Verrucomicrobium sp. BvORR034 TaxID=1396418 RepID=UPI002240F428|nr:hypothetical protein [Verrucomicrobium sp. BvORR034]
MPRSQSNRGSKSPTAQAGRDSIYSYVAGTRMVLFQSVDLEGSTGYKQRLADGQNQKWRQAITDFLEEFPQCYRSNYASLQRKKKLPQCPQAVLWKVLGDELVFKAEVTRGAEVSLLTTAFREALGEYNSKIDELQRERRDQRSPDGGAQLRVKGSSWTAGFPVTNAVIHTGTVFDYIGPSMDMGFRLGALATPQRLAISVELAWLLGTFDAKFPFHFAGRTTIKGVSEGVGYPYLWIEIPSSTYYERELDLVGGQRLRPHVIADLCYHFIKEHGVPGYLPFLISESEKTAKPSDYNTRLKKHPGRSPARLLSR